MANFADAIRSFHRGSQSHRDFFARVESALASETAAPARLLDILGEEHARLPLPPDVYAELRQRIEDGARREAGGDETRAPIQAFDRRAAAPEARTFAASGPGAADAGLERMKGVGDTLNGRFVLEECIGFGGMGTVYRALDLRKLEASDRKPYIAIKVLNVQFRGHPKSLIALQREARKAQMLAHPNIVTVYDFDRDGSMVYLTMEYLSGKPLSHVLRAPDFAGLPYAEVLPIISGISKALAYAHERGFVHCDLKPANVFLLDKGDVKVIDFGIARVFHKTEEDSEATVFDAGSLGGLTPAYASPEMIEHLEPDPRDDIYGLACITYELLTGRHPFDRLSATQARSAGMRPQRPRGLGLRQWRALRTALSFERASRTPTVAEFLHEMSGETSKSVYVALAASGLTLALLVTAGLGYYLASRPPSGARPGMAAGDAAAPAPAAGKADGTASAGADAEGASAARAGKPAELDMAAVTPVLAQVPCSLLAAKIQGDTLRVEGFLARRVGEARLRQMLAAIPGAGAIEVEARGVADADCAVIETYRPYWQHNRAAGAAAQIRTRAQGAQLHEGDPLIVDIRTPSFPGYVQVDYFALGGDVAHLVPNQRARAHQAPANYEAAIGSLGNWVIAPPFGEELIVLLVTPAPLFDNPRPEVESRAQYLRLAADQLQRLAAAHGTEKIVADVVQITTSPRGR